MFEHVQRQPLAFFTRAQTGALVSRLNTDVVGAQQAITTLLSQAVSMLLTLVLVLGMMFYLSWQITLAALVMVPFFLLPAKLVGRRLQRRAVPSSLGAGETRRPPFRTRWQAPVSRSKNDLRPQDLPDLCGHGRCQPPQARTHRLGKVHHNRRRNPLGCAGHGSFLAARTGCCVGYARAAASAEWGAQPSS